jgi:hypothetical protein
VTELNGDYGEYFIRLVYTLLKRGVEIREIGYRSPQRLYGLSKTSPDLFTLILKGIKYIKTVITLNFSL